MENLIFPNATISIQTLVRSSATDALNRLLAVVGLSKLLPRKEHYKADEASKTSAGESSTDGCDDDRLSSSCTSDLFQVEIRVDTLTPVRPSVRACAVDEFEYDFTSSNPFDWDLQPLNLETTHISNAKENATRMVDVRSFTEDPQDLLSGVVAVDDDCGVTVEHTHTEADAPVEHVFSPAKVVAPTDDEYDGNEFALDEEMWMHLGRPGDYDSSSAHSNSSNNSPLSELTLNRDSPVDLFNEPVEHLYSHSLSTHSSLPQSAKGRRSSTEKGSLLDDESDGARSGEITKKISTAKLVCDTCGAKFRSQKTLINHELKHELKYDTTAAASATRTSSLSSQVSGSGSASASTPSADSRDYVCKVCGATFRVKSYLSRHMWKHEARKPFHCPFFGDGKHGGTPCHPTGGFCRRDTFKTHLKALHFVYPTGTKSTNRNSQSGRCAGCFKEFDNNNEWLKKHIATNECPAMLIKYK